MNKVICELCEKNEANCFSFFEKYDKKECKLVCDCAIGEEDYYIKFDSFFRTNAEQKEWIRHMNQKYWFDEKNFLEKVDLLNVNKNN